jgi:hypothetical protein
MAFPNILVLVGSGRSGTTYLTRVLRKTYDFGFASEPKFVVQIYRRLGSFGDLRDDANLARLVDRIHRRSGIFTHMRDVLGISTTPGGILRFVKERSYSGVLYAVFAYAAAMRGNARLAYKDPGDVLHLELLSRLLPTARFLHIFRDGRDVALSNLKFRWGPTNIYRGALEWSRATDEGCRQGRLLGDRYLEISLERLVSDSEGTCRLIHGFLRGFGDFEGSEQELLDEVLRSKSKSVTGWTQAMTDADVHLAEAASGETLSRLGYARRYPDARVGRLARGWYETSDLLRRSYNHVFNRVLWTSGFKRRWPA